MGRKPGQRREPANLSRARDAIHQLVGTERPKTGGKNRKDRRKDDRSLKKQRRFQKNPLAINEKAVLEAADQKVRKDQRPKQQQQKQKQQKAAPSDDRKTLFGATDGKQAYDRNNLTFANRFEDREIRYLEKQMKLKKKTKLPKGFAEDGLDYILDLCETTTAGIADGKKKGKESGGGKRLSELEQYVQEKRQAAAARPTGKGRPAARGEEEDSDEEMLGMEEDSDFGSDDDDMLGDGEEDDDFGDDDIMGEDSDVSDDVDMDGEEEDEAEVTGKGKDVSQAAGATANKYIPPALRQKAQSSAADQALSSSALMRQVKGLINRLCESTLKPTVTQLQQLYIDNSRNDTNQCLSITVMSACVTPALQPDRLLAEHMLLVAVLHRLVDTNVGCHFLELLVRKFDAFNSTPAVPPSSAPGADTEGMESKQYDNIILLLSHLYLFKVAHSSLIYDLIRRLLNRLHDKDVTLLLLLLRTCGAEIRKDDPEALKTVVSLVRTKSAEVTYIEQSRMRFMLDTVMAVCHNNMRKIPGYDPQSLQHRQRVLRGLVPPAVPLADAQMNIAYDDFVNVEEKGRWWVIGSAWSGRAPNTTASRGKRDQEPSTGTGDRALDKKLVKLARQQHLNTDVRRNIFSVLMTCEDVFDAVEKLLRLQLKDQQERELIHVVLHCCMQEKTFNVFYALLMDRLCGLSRSHQVTLKFALWDKLKAIDSLNKRQRAVLMALMSHLLVHKTLSLTLFKMVDFSQLTPGEMAFFQQFFVQLVANHKQDTVMKVFQSSPAAPPAHLALFVRFLEHQVKDGTVRVPTGSSAELICAGCVAIADAFD